MSQCLRLLRRQHCKIAEMGFTGSFRLVGAVGGLKGGKDKLSTWRERAGGATVPQPSQGLTTKFANANVEQRLFYCKPHTQKRLARTLSLPAGAAPLQRMCWDLAYPMHHYPTC